MATLDLELHEKQGIAFETEATEVLYGGAAGGGKSHLMRIAAIIWCAEIAGLQVYLFRRIHADLVRNHIEGPTGFREILAPWSNEKAPNGKPWAQIIDDEIRFWNGSKIFLCHCEHEKHKIKYQGPEIHVLLIDELTHFTETIYRFLRNRLRKPKALKIPKKYEGMFPRVLCGSNPGSEGHLWVKSTFIDGTDSYEIRDMPKSEGGMKRQFIPALLEDNPSLDAEEYEGKLLGLGSEALVAAMRYGDWDVIEGAYFDCWDSKRHVVTPFSVPKHWMRFRSMDWGSAKPFSVGWWAVCSDDHVAENKLGQKLVIPKGAIVRYREWYGAKKANVGLKLKNTAIGKGILEREVGEKIDYGVLDSACFADTGGPTIYQQMCDGKLDGKIAYFRPTENKTRVTQDGVVGGWDVMRARMLGDDDGRAMIFCFSTCHDSIRTIPALQHDKTRAEDLDSDMEDHAADDWRYACVSRPWVRPEPQKKTTRNDGYKPARDEGAESWR